MFSTNYCSSSVMQGLEDDPESYDFDCIFRQERFDMILQADIPKASNKKKKKGEAVEGGVRVF